jgi:hypothetical protein
VEANVANKATHAIAAGGRGIGWCGAGRAERSARGRTGVVRTNAAAVMEAFVAFERTCALDARLSGIGHVGTGRVAIAAVCRIGHDIDAAVATERGRRVGTISDALVAARFIGCASGRSSLANDSTTAAIVHRRKSIAAVGKITIAVDRVRVAFKTAHTIVATRRGVASGFARRARRRSTTEHGAVRHAHVVADVHIDRADQLACISHASIRQDDHVRCVYRSVWTDRHIDVGNVDGTIGDLELLKVEHAATEGCKHDDKTRRNE